MQPLLTRGRALCLDPVAVLRLDFAYSICAREDAVRGFPLLGFEAGL